MVTPKPKKKPVKVSTPVCADDSFHGVPRTPKAVQKEVKVYADSPRAERKSSGTGFEDFACEERRPKRKAALVSMESTREIVRDLKKSRSPRSPSERIPPPKAQWAVPPPRTPSLSNSMAAVDFTGAVDLMCLSRSGSGELTPHHGDGDVKSEGGAKMEQLGQDLLCHLTQIPDSIMRDLRGIEGELLSAHWDMQASEAAMKAVAEQVLVERTEDTNKKRARYWEARSKLEEFIQINLNKK
ncbi:hypothetical protein BSKO_10004 [Bryopsis sp. KO-2023]|nr:hypothetical protein BSKO_10004 [Bryopsis sp. KO-2023]